MDVPQEHIETLTKNLDRYEQQARRRAWLSAIVPAIFGLILLMYTIWQIRVYGEKLVGVQQELNTTNQQLTTANTALQDASKQLEQAKVDLGSLQNRLESITTELKKTQQELKDAQQQLQEAREDLKSTSTFAENAFALDVYAMKGGALGQYPIQEEILFEIDNLRYSGISWNRHGYSESEGFNSPSFASYILQNHGLSGGYGVKDAPSKYLHPIDIPSIGDIVYYKGGFTMFYYEFYEEPFVIGMTQIGIVSLKPGFANIIGYFCVPYPGRTCP